jgi:TM2 domain-containing membrane protein YozV
MISPEVKILTICDFSKGGSSMKISYKAALLSAFVFPGAGQLYLKRYWQGLSIMVIALAGFGYIIWQTTVSVLHRFDGLWDKLQDGKTDVQGIADMIGASPMNTSPYDNIILLVVICCWIISIVDAYISGKRKELPGAT